MDETKFLSDYYSRNKDKGVEIMGLAYERSTDFERSAKSLQSFRKRFDVQYPILVTGVTVSDSLRAEKTLPQIEKINAFPTTNLIDRKGDVRKIHTGFTGPGTGEHYDEFKKEFDECSNINKNLKIIYTITDEAQNQSGTNNWQGEKGRIDKAMLARYFGDSEQNSAVFYICGPPAMIKAMQELLQDLEISSDQIMVEEFTGY